MFIVEGKDLDYLDTYQAIDADAAICEARSVRPALHAYDLLPILTAALLIRAHDQQLIPFTR